MATKLDEYELELLSGRPSPAAAAAATTQSKV